MRTIEAESFAIIVRNPRWLRLSSWIGFPLISLTCIFLLGVLFSSLRNYGSIYDQTIVISCAGLLCAIPLYACFQGFTLFPYLKLTIKADLEGFALHSADNGRVGYYRWLHIGSIIDRVGTGLVEFQDESGSRVLVISEWAVNYSPFITLARSQENINEERTF